MKNETKLELLKLSVALVDVMQRTGEISGRKALPADKIELSETLGVVRNMSFSTCCSYIPMTRRN